MSHVFAQVFENHILNEMIRAHCSHKESYVLARMSRRYLHMFLKCYGSYYDEPYDVFRLDPKGLRFLRTSCADRCRICTDSQREYDLISDSLALRPRKPCLRFSRGSTDYVDIPRVLCSYLFGGGIHELDLSGEGENVDSTTLGSILGLLNNDAIPGQQYRPHNWRCTAPCRMLDSAQHLVCRCTINFPDFDIEPLENVRRVKKISICDTAVGDEGIEMLRHAFEESELKLDASWCMNITDRAVAQLIRPGMRKLTHLDLGGDNGITDAGILQLQYAPFKLVLLGVSRLHISDRTLHAILPYPDVLKTLDISRCNQITDHGIYILTERCENLRNLEAFACHSIGPDAVAALVAFARTHESFREATVSQYADEDEDDLDTYDLDCILHSNQNGQATPYPYLPN